MEALLHSEDRSNWRKVRVPKFTRIGNVRYQPIYLNYHRYDPGEVYELPPEIADELEAAIERHQGMVFNQMSPPKMLPPEVKDELEAQKQFTESVLNNMTVGPVQRLS